MKYEVRNHKIYCPICNNDTFEKDYRQLNTKVATFFNFDWANQDATILICHQCTHISWFMDDAYERN